MTEQSFEEPPSTSGNSDGAINTNENVNGVQATDDSNHMASLKNEILNFLCENNEIYFKSQQIDDPELTMNEKKQIACEILEKNRGNFLSRFGRYLKNEHLNYFEIKNTNNDIDDGDGREMNVDENDGDYEVKLLVKDLRKNLEKKHKIIKNRRYAAMQALIKENSEKEMMQLEPYLYEQIVGQYLTESEKRIRDSYDPKNTTFSNILFDIIDKKRMDELRKEQENDEQMSGNNDDDIVSQSSFRSDDGNSSKATSEIGTPPICRKQWGNFDDESDNQNLPISSSKSNQIRENRGRNKNYQEFLMEVTTKCLEGDLKNFDYTKVDDNADLDDLKQINQDNEDRYFDESDDDDDDNLDTTHDIHRMDEDIETEDELDVYMKHLNRHPALRKRNDDEEEEEEED